MHSLYCGGKRDKQDLTGERVQGGSEGDAERKKREGNRKPYQQTYTIHLVNTHVRAHACAPVKKSQLQYEPVCEYLSEMMGGTLSFFFLVGLFQH